MQIHRFTSGTYRDDQAKLVAQFDWLQYTQRQIEAVEDLIAANQQRSWEILLEMHEWHDNAVRAWTYANSLYVRALREFDVRHRTTLLTAPAGTSDPPPPPPSEHNPSASMQIRDYLSQIDPLDNNGNQPATTSAGAAISSQSVVGSLDNWFRHNILRI